MKRRAPLIGLTGGARCGKNTVGTWLSEMLVIPTYAIAMPIKAICSEVMGWDERHLEGALKEVVDPRWGISPRHAFQTLGTDWGRNMIHPDIWIRLAQRVYESSTRGLILTDVRFESEADWLDRMGGMLVHVRRVNLEEHRKDVPKHESEKLLPWRYHDVVMTPCATLDELREETGRVYRLFAERPHL